MDDRLSLHLSFAELACVNRLGRRWQHWAPGEIIAEYPKEWRDDRALRLAATFEDIRQALGNKPIIINSAYRTSDYNKTIGGVKLSQHVLGRALDIHHSKLHPDEVYVAIRHMDKAGKLPLLGGCGLYKTFVHIDVRPRQASGRIALWSGDGVETPMGIG